MPQNLWQTLTLDATLRSAWEKVRNNLGAPGIDRVSVQEFEANLESNLALLRQILESGAYEPMPLESFTASKKSGKKRVLHKSTVRDRIVHEALLLVLRPVFEPTFLDCSYAYRTGRSQQKAIERVERNLKRGRDHFFDGDILSFFDEIDRKMLLKMVAEHVSEKRILSLLEKCINVKENPEGKGIAQGLAIAPLLSNVYLHPFDDSMMRAQWVYIRFSDNILVLDKSEEQIKAAMARATEKLKELRLSLNEEKTSHGHISKGFVFLGFHFDQKGKRPAAAAVQRLSGRIGEALGNRAGLSEKQLKDKLESIVRGWLNYFQLNETDKRKLFEQLEQEFSDQADSMPQQILKAALSYQLGDHLKARSTLQGSPAISSDDAEMNYQWGLLCSLTGLTAEALDSFLAAYRANPEHPETAYHLGLHYLHQSKPEQAIRYLQKAVQVDPENARSHFALGVALQKLALHGAARKAFQKASQLDPQMRKLLPENARQRPSDKPASLQFTDADVACFLNLFSGREGVFARQWLSENGKSGYQPIYQPLSEQEISAHLKGEQTLGLYLMRSDNTVSQMIVDLDLTRQVRVEIADPGRSFQEWQHLLWADAYKLRQALMHLGISAYVEDSGYKGLHLWTFFAEPLPAKQVLLFGKKLIEQAGPAPPGINRELFPKQPHVAPEALGAMIKLPLGIHKATGRRCLFLDDQGQPFHDQIGMLRSVQTVSENDFSRAFDQLRKSSVLPQKEIPAQEQEKIDKILKGCNVLRYFKEKAQSEKWLTHLERLTVLNILANLGEAGAREIHNIIRQTSNYNFRITQKFINRKKGFPVSCPKVRQWHSHITPVIGCCCQFPNRKNSYPSPVLHADPDLIARLKAGAKKETTGSTLDQPKIVRQQDQRPANKEPQAPAPETPGPERTGKSERLAGTDIVDIDRFVHDFLEAKKAHRRTAQRLAELEDKLNAFSKKTGKAVFETDFGTVRQIESGGKLKWIIEI